MTPIYILSGQSNAVALNNVDTFRQQILAAEPDAIVIEYAAGATAMYPGVGVDWHAANDGLTNTGELFSVLVSQIITALEKHPDAYIAGMGWIQGENDAIAGYGLDYAENLGLMVDRLAEIFGEFPMAVMALSDNASAATRWEEDWRQVQEGQIQVAEKYESVTLLDPDVIAQQAGFAPSQMFGDYVHYYGPTLRALGPAMADHLLAIDAENGVEEPTVIHYDKIELIYSTRNGTAGADKLTGYAGNEKFYGRAGNDTINGGDGHDRLYGENGNDVLTGGNGGDLLTGGAGNDVFVFGGASGRDVIQDFNLAADQLSFADVTVTTDFNQSSNPEGDLVLSWNYAGETQSATLVGIMQADFDSINFTFGM